MRVSIFILGIVAMATGAAITVSPAHADCQIVNCHRECYPVAGGMRCQSRCQRRCWHAAPQYVPPPQYVPAPAPVYPITPNYDYSAPAHGGSSEIAVLVMLILTGLLIAGMTSSTSATTQVEAEIEAALQTNASVGALADEAAAKNAEIDAFIETTARARYERGRAAADEEWTRD